MRATRRWRSQTAPTPALRACATVFALAWFFFAGGVRAFALEPDQIALVVNANVPEGKKLAERYARVRHIPDGRIIELSLPAADPASPPEELTPALYDAQVAPIIRAFLSRQHLEQKVTCLVTFWGVPLRIGKRSTTALEKAEQSALESQFKQELAPNIEKEVLAAETLARELNPDFHPAGGTTMRELAARAAAAMNSAFSRIALIEDGKRRGAAFERMLGHADRLYGADMTLARLAESGIGPLAPNPPTPEQARQARERLNAARGIIALLSADQREAKTREKVRGLAKESSGLLGHAEQVALQISLLDVDSSDAALDSELALLWWPDYSKARWLQNPLFWRNAGRAAGSHTLMVTRLDGPSVGIVQNMIDVSVKVEQEGLHGQAVLDGYGKPPTHPYGAYDQSIRHLAEVLRQRTKLPVTYEDTDALIPANSQKDIALYCGWYSVREFVPPGRFNAGAVGFHVASYELVSLRGRGEKGWVRGLENAGVVATVGAVAEPYLQSFPLADEFFPLLLTGKLALAEVFWRTSPWVSWMQTCVGDPLYRPYLKNPQIDPSTLPDAMLAPVR